jgi:hypothetical protein
MEWTVAAAGNKYLIDYEDKPGPIATFEKLA